MSWNTYNAVNNVHDPTGQTVNGNHAFQNNHCNIDLKNKKNLRLSYNHYANDNLINYLVTFVNLNLVVSMH